MVKKRKDPPGGGSKPREVDYALMPPGYTRKFILNDDTGSRDKYMGMIEWIACLCTMDGSNFLDLKNLHCNSGYPLIQAEIVYNHQWVKVLISRHNAYVVGGISSCGRFQFLSKGTGFDILGFLPLEECDGKYHSSPWRQAGPAGIISAIEVLNLPNHALKDCGKGLEAFAFHLSEGVRFMPIRKMIAKMLEATEGEATVTYEHETLLRAQEGYVPKKDIMKYVQGGGIDVTKFKKTPLRMRKMINNFSKLSKIWFWHALSNGKVFILDKEVAEACNMGTCKSLRCILGVLCNTNLGKIEPEMWKKAKSLRLQYTAEDHEVVKEIIRKLKDDGKAHFGPKDLTF